ncbi:pentatricopeptide repeat-containing protein [Prunus yedoensis var. nudiflora]|uniref:Pentatricopeptide repeat-containing protein n=1 Tax=Prunus yedoensis var. nudiflora TaxID=2094558 RepID=A0A314ZCB0_PRUYE|nr:pentatricopeptide repeat-containing protein [Prunus yedoensis var. nudiflora]
MQQSGFEPDFETHWSLISNLSNSSDKDNANSSRGFLARLLSSSGFSRQKDSKTKLVACDFGKPPSLDALMVYNYSLQWNLKSLIRKRSVYE